MIQFDSRLLLETGHGIHRFDYLRTSTWVSWVARGVKVEKLCPQCAVTPAPYILSSIREFRKLMEDFSLYCGHVCAMQTFFLWHLQACQTGKCNVTQGAHLLAILHHQVSTVAETLTEYGGCLSIFLKYNSFWDTQQHDIFYIIRIYSAHVLH